MLGLGFLGVFFICFGIGALLGLAYALIKGIPVFKMMGLESINVVKDLGCAIKEGVTEGIRDGNAKYEARLEKKGLK